MPRCAQLTRNDAMKCYYIYARPSSHNEPRERARADCAPPPARGRAARLSRGRQGGGGQHRARRARVRADAVWYSHFHLAFFPCLSPPRFLAHVRVHVLSLSLFSAVLSLSLFHQFALIMCVAGTDKRPRTMVGAL